MRNTAKIFLSNNKCCATAFIPNIELFGLYNPFYAVLLQQINSVNIRGYNIFSCDAGKAVDIIIDAAFSEAAIPSDTHRPSKARHPPSDRRSAIKADRVGTPSVPLFISVMPEPSS